MPSRNSTVSNLSQACARLWVWVARLHCGLAAPYCWGCQLQGLVWGLGLASPSRQLICYPHFNCTGESRAGLMPVKLHYRPFCHPPKLHVCKRPWLARMGGSLAPY